MVYPPRSKAAVTGGSVLDFIVRLDINRTLERAQRPLTTMDLEHTNQLRLAVTERLAKPTRN